MPRLSKIGAAALAAFGWTGLSSVTASYLVVAGGGGGGAGGAGSGGGGAGGLLTGSVSLNPTTTYTVTVGAGAVGRTGSGYSSSTPAGSDSTFSTVTATGGGGGSSGNNVGGSGGSGGGGNGGYSTAGGSGTSGQGFAGGAGVAGGYIAPNETYAGGGGGGAGAVGANGQANTTTLTEIGGNGGAGTASSITGSSVTYAGGGGGSCYGGNATSRTGGSGGAGGGGSGGTGDSVNGTSGTANLGGGGGAGGGTNTTSGGNGGSGVVIISYVGAQQFGGGVVTSSGGNTIHTFTTSGTLSPLNSLTASYLIVAGGGGGATGVGGSANGGGGGAGGLLSGSSLTIDTNSIYAVAVGAGGATNNNGSNSSFSMVSTAAVGGGSGGFNTGNGQTGGSGGGASSFSTSTAGAGTSGQGNAGGTQVTNTGTGGGGGASSVGGNASGVNGGNGGSGTASSISGSSVTYAGGGGGSTNTGGTAGTGGSGGGGVGGVSAAGTAGTANLGGGGGGGAASAAGGAGGSGVVIISYAGSTQQMAGGTVTVAGGNVIHTFTSSGYLTPIVLVTNSLRFRESASSYLNRTPTTAGNRQKFTLSVWYKPGNIGTSFTNANFLSAGGDGSNILIAGAGAFGATVENRFVVRENNATSQFYWPMVFRDPAAWYHIVLAVDTTQATSANRAKLYVNGVDQGAFSGTGYSQNDSTSFNNTTTQYIGAFNSSFYYTSCYFAEYTWIDGQQLTPNSFGTSNGLGVWQPIRYGGSYGTNGFYLPFPNNSTGASISASYLVVAGGGGGGRENYASGQGGGGGAGGLLTGTTSIASTSSYIITVGGGGTAGGAGTVGGNGSNSVFSSFTSIGGGGGGGGSSDPSNGANGGSGGGDVNLNGTAGTGTVGQGNNGGDTNAVGQAAGGGGGAGAVGGTGTGSGSGSVGGVGGAGTASSISGSSVTYAGGGGGSGGVAGGGSGGAGGAGGGGKGSDYPSGGANGVAGTANTGGGGGGGDNNGHTSGAGGSGVVIVSYAGTQRYTGGTVTTSGGNTIHTFTSSGVLTSIFNDFSPNGNNWTGNNINVSTLGSTYDSMTDVPTLTSATAANYCVLNPIFNVNGTNVTYSNGNLTFSHPANSGNAQLMAIRGTIALPAGKYYWEYIVGATVNDQVGIGNNVALGGSPDGTAGARYLNSGAFQSNYTNPSSAASYTTNDIIGVAYDQPNGTLAFYKNNSLQGTITNISTTEVFFPSRSPSSSGTGGAGSFNFGQQPFAYTPPTNFVALNTFNLPTPTIGATASTQASAYMNNIIWTGNGTSTRTLTGLNFQPDFVWTKSRSNAYYHNLYDVVRGFGSAKSLHSNDTLAEGTLDLTYGYVSAATSSGFSVADGSTSGQYVNENGSTYVAWNWKANATAVTNTNGSIISTVSANTTSGFSIVTYTGNNTASTVGHGLGVAPSMYIVKARTQGTGYNWSVYHASLGATQYISLNLTNASATASTVWNNTAPTSTVFSLGNDPAINGNTLPFVAYCFAQVAGYSAFGSYTGNGSTDGPFVYTGFRPRFIMIKCSTTGGISYNWALVDSTRSYANVANHTLAANSADASSSYGTGVDVFGPYNQIDLLSNGFKIRDTGVWGNASGATYVYMAFAENPFKYANAR